MPTSLIVSRAVCHELTSLAKPWGTWRLVAMVATSMKPWPRPPRLPWWQGPSHPSSCFDVRSSFCSHSGDEALKRAAGPGPASSHHWQPLLFPDSETPGDEQWQRPILHFAQQEGLLVVLPSSTSISAKKGNLVARPINHEMWSWFNKIQDIRLASALNVQPASPHTKSRLQISNIFKEKMPQGVFSGFIQIRTWKQSLPSPATWRCLWELTAKWQSCQHSGHW